ncbi:MAG: nucleotidyltransferase family protein [Firmicutes bacterium]|nr:nucleotidyltransferase family protein [Bacillota bacterium]
MNSSEFLYTAVILTAGESRRMGFPKALLEAGEGRKFIENIFLSLSGIVPEPSEIIAVLGFHRERILSEAEIPESCRIVFNPDPERGQLSSLIEALKYIKSEKRVTAGIMMCLVDHPFVDVSTFQKIAETAAENPGMVVIPKYSGRKGHPVFFPSEIFEDLLESPLEEGARHAVNKNRDRLIVVDVDDPAILKDVDTPSDYRNHTGRNPGE